MKSSFAGHVVELLDTWSGDKAKRSDIYSGKVNIKIDGKDHSSIAALELRPFFDRPADRYKDWLAVLILRKRNGDALSLTIIQRIDPIPQGKFSSENVRFRLLTINSVSMEEKVITFNEAKSIPFYAWYVRYVTPGRAGLFPDEEVQSFSSLILKLLTSIYIPMLFLLGLVLVITHKRAPLRV